MPETSPTRRALPPFEQTLAGYAASLGDVALDATIGREACAALDAPVPRHDGTLDRTLAASAEDLAALPLVLPRISIDLAEPPFAGVAPEGPDLRIVGRLGEGGMGVVALAQQRSLERHVAVKMPRVDAPASAFAAISAEAVATGRLEHPNIVPVHALGRSDDGRPVMVMKRIEGVAFRDLLAQPDHPLWETIGSGDPLADRLQILGSVANALEFAHSRGIVHRDVKPENVMVGGFGEVVLVDFGLAVATDRPQTHERGIVGTPVYMAPEMVAGWDVDARTDVHLLGGTLHEILTGRPPHEGDTLTEVLARAYAAEPPAFSDDVPEELAAICSKALARHPDDRFPDARSFRLAIRDFLTHRASHALVERAEERVARARADAEARARRAALTEARFACRQALELWDANHRARAVEGDVLRETLVLELDERNLAAARALADELADVPAALAARIEALASQLEEERRQGERLRALERDLDATVGAGARRFAVVIFAIAGFSVSVYVMRRMSVERVRAIDLVPIALGMFVFVTSLLAVLWKRIARNAFGRKLAIVGWSTNVMMLFHRIVSAISDAPVAQVLSVDSVIFTGMIAATGILVDTRLLYGLPLPIAGALVGAAYPAHAAQAFSASTIALLLLAAAYYRNVDEGGA